MDQDPSLYILDTVYTWLVVPQERKGFHFQGSGLQTEIIIIIINKTKLILFKFQVLSN